MEISPLETNQQRKTSNQQDDVKLDVGQRIVDLIRDSSKGGQTREQTQTSSRYVRYWDPPLPSPRDETRDPLYLFDPTYTPSEPALLSSSSTPAEQSQERICLVPMEIGVFLDTCRTVMRNQRSNEISVNIPSNPWKISYSQIPLGLVDEPEMQKRRPLLIDLLGEDEVPNSGGALLIVGTQGFGKGTALRTIALWLTMRFTHEEARCVVIDPNGDLSWFKEQRVFKRNDGSSLYYSGETEEECQEALVQVAEFVDQRKEQLEEQFKAGMTGPEMKFSFQRALPNPIPMCLLIVAEHDTLAPFDKKKQSINSAIQLAMNARELGVSTIVTTTTLGRGAMPEAVMAGFKNRIVLNCDDNSRNALLTRQQARMAEEIEGRAIALIARSGSRAAQLALPVPGDTRDLQRRGVEDLLGRLSLSSRDPHWESSLSGS